MTGNRDETAFGTGLALLALAVAVGLVVQSAAAGAVAPADQDPTPDPPADDSSRQPGSDEETPDEENATTGIGSGGGGTSATLARSVHTQQRGDVVQLKLEFSGRARQARVTLGSAAKVGYEVRFRVRDGDRDGEVVVYWNTATSHAPDAGLSVDGSGGDEFSSGPTVVEGTDEPVEPAEYPVSVVVHATDTETDLGRVVVKERAAHDLTVHSAPASVQAFESVREVERAAAGRSGVDEIAVSERASDWVVVRLDASGLSGQAEAALDGDVDGLRLTVEESSATVGPNEQPIRMPLDANVSLFANVPRDRYYLVFRASELLDAGAEVGDEFTVTFAADERNAVTETNETLTTTFTVVEGRASVDLEADELLASATRTAEVTGTTSWAPGTRLLVHLHSSGGPGNATAFTAEAEAVVAADGSWTARVDLSEAVAGQSVDVRVFHRNTSVLQVDAEGELGQLEASVGFANQVADDGGTLVVVDSVSLERGGFVTIRKNGPRGPVIGVSDYLGPGTHENVPVRLDVNETVTNETRLAAVAHVDTDGNRQFGYVVTDGAVDGPYTDYGFPVAAVATVYAEAPLDSEEQP